MKFMILIYGNETAWSALSEANVDELARCHEDIKRELVATKEFVAAAELDEKMARVVCSIDAKPVVNNAPFSEGEQIVSGYYIVECIDVERATAIASRFAEAKFAPIEVRRMSGGSTWDELQHQRS